MVNCVALAAQLERGWLVSAADDEVTV